MGYRMRTDRYRFTVWVTRTSHNQFRAIELYDRHVEPQKTTTSRTGLRTRPSWANS